MAKIIKNNWLFIAGVGFGAVGGYAYYYFVGCSSGTCSITSSPVNSTLYGSLMGGLILSGLKKEKITNNSASNEKI